MFKRISILTLLSEVSLELKNYALLDGYSDK